MVDAFCTRKNNLPLRVLSVTMGVNGETLLLVCKAECSNPMMGQFAVRPQDVVSA